MLRVFLQALFGIGVLAAFVLALLVAWWIALFGILALSVYLAVRRFLGGWGRRGDLPATLEGEYRQVEPDRRTDVPVRREP